MFVYSRSLHGPLFRLFTTTSRSPYPRYSLPSSLPASIEDAGHLEPTSSQEPTRSPPERDADATFNESVSPAPITTSVGIEQPIPSITGLASSSPNAPNQSYQDAKLRLLEKLMNPRTVPELPSATSKTGSSGSQDDISPEPDPLLPLPSVPGVQTPRWLNRNEGMVYLTPLYQRGWYVSTEPLPDGKRRTAFTLKKIFKLRKRVWCASFMKEVADTMVALKHDGTLLLDTLSLTAEFHTHDTYAIIPRGRIDHPGITLRDIELAVAIENLWTKRQDDGQVSVDDASSKATLTKKAKEGEKLHIYGLVDAALHLRYATLHTSTIRLQTSEHRHVCSICGRTHPERIHEGPCPACHGAHAIFDCTVRHTIRPPHPCLNCNDWHWLADCPQGPNTDHTRKTTTPPSNSQKHDRSVDKRDMMKHEIYEQRGITHAPFACLACGGSHHIKICPSRGTIPPKTRCPRCGQLHWWVDCPLRNPSVGSRVPPSAAVAGSTEAVTESAAETVEKSTAVSEDATETTGTKEAVGEGAAHAAPNDLWKISPEP